MNKINILITTDGNYLPHAYELINSIKMYNENKLNIFLVYCDLKDTEINEFKEFIVSNNYGNVHTYYIDASKYDLPLQISYLSITAYIRLFAPLLIKEKIDRILYLDCDIICRGSILPLYNADFEGKPIAACINMNYETNPDFNYNLGLDIENEYINSGVLLINIDEYKKIVNEQIIIDCITEYRDRLVQHDQDLINILFYKNMKLLSTDYNYQILRPEREAKIDSCLTHYAESPKPWEDSYFYFIKGIPYYEYLIKNNEKDKAYKLIKKHIHNYSNILVNKCDEDLFALYDFTDKRNELLENRDKYVNTLSKKFYNDIVDNIGITRESLECKKYYKKTAKLFDSLEIKYNDTYYFYYIDYNKKLIIDKEMIQNMPIDYSKVMLSLNSIRENSSNLEHIDILFDSIVNYINRVIDSLDDNNKRTKELKKYFKRIISNDVSSFDEALQRILFYNQLLWQTGHKLMGLGRLDKILYEYYINDINLNVITKETAKEMLGNFLSILHVDYEYKSNELLGDIGQLIILGGNDKDGNYLCNDLTFMFIDLVKELQIPDPKILLRVSKKTPKEIIKSSIDCIKTGIGSPLFANDDIIIKSLLSAGYSKDDVYNYGVSACWEPLIIGSSFDQNNLIDLRFLYPLEYILNNYDLTIFESFDELLNAYKEEMYYYVKDIVEYINSIDFQEDPLLSIFVNDCVFNNKDIAHGGARYNNVGVLSVGISNLINSLLIIKKYVFDDKRYTLEELNNRRINNDFDGLEIVKKFGNDDKYVIELTNKIMNITSDEFKKYKNKFGGNFKFGLSSAGYITTSYNSESSLDGRSENTPYNVHISYDGIAPTELINFASQLDYSINKFNANVVDYIVSPDFIDSNYDDFLNFIILSIKNGFFEMQMNVVSSSTLIEAKNNPDKFPNLIVRVWGFSAYFNDLPEEYKNILIDRVLKSEGVK